MNLHKSPTGLLEALALKVLGRNPPEFGDLVRPSYNATQHYRQDLLRIWQDNATITAGNVLTTACVIPDRSLWRLRLVSIFMIDVGAATAKTMWIHCTMPQINRDTQSGGFATNALPQTLFFVDPIARAVINRAAGSWQPTQDFFVPGGSTIRGTLGAPLANDISINFTVLYEEMGAQQG